ncbi:MAG: amidohydrolase [Bacteroidaceae bacterium]|nr:amidohydrolase [Bacteroidaceae bacterium]
MNILIQNAEVFLPSGEVKKCDVAIEGDIIKYVGDVPADFHAGRTIDGTDKFLTPGFVNAHTHVSMTLFRSYADDMELMDWLHNKIWPVEAKMGREDIYWGAQLAAVEMIKSGTTCFADMYRPYMDEVAKTVIESGLRASLSSCMLDFGEPDNPRIAEGSQFFKDFHGAEGGRIKVMFAPHAPYTCPPDYLKKINAEAQKVGAEIHIHMAETVAETEGILKQYGMRPFAYVEQSGIFENGTLAAHCVHLNDEDFAIIKKYNIRVAHNPISNMKLASGSSPVSRLLKEGVVVGIGTDGASSNNNLDMIEEMKIAAMLEKCAKRDPLAVSALDSLNMATRNGAIALSMPETGQIAPGFKADIVLHDLNSAAWCPRHNLVSLLVYSASSATVNTVICDGKILLDNGSLTTLDEERIMHEAARCAKRLVN